MTGGGERVVIGIDLGGTNCRGALVSHGGRAGELRRVPTLIEEGLESFVERFSSFCGGLAREAEDGGFKPVAFGIGVPGVIGSEGMVRISPNLQPLNGVPLAKTLRKRLGLPILIVNDANAIAWGEALYGAGREYSSFLVVTLGTGVGGGLVLDRRLWEGADGAAGEVGHIMVEPEGRPCGCGSRGCLEQYASATGIVKTALEILAAGGGGLLAEGAAELTSHQVSVAARQGDRTALKALELAGSRLGQVLAGVANLLNLEAAIISGGASESLDLMRPFLEEELRKRAFRLPGNRLRILRGELGDDAGILGAAGFAWDRIAREPDLVN